MSTIFSTGKYNRGCFRKIPLDTGGGEGTKLAGLEGEDSIIIVGFSFNKEEGIGIVKCFKDQNFIYTFGDSLDASMLGVKVVGMMAEDGKPLDKMKNFYATNRVSQNNKTVKLTYGSASAALEGYVIGMDSDTISAEFNLQSFNIKLLLIGLT